MDKIMMTTSAPAGTGRAGIPCRRGRGFSLIEVLLAIFILGIGMIMVASVFPVGAEWTRQTTEDSVAQAIAQNAVSVVRTYYGRENTKVYVTPANSTLYDMLIPGNLTDASSGTTPSQYGLQALPGFTNIPANQRAYQFGNAFPFPANNPLVCNYFWTALIRLQPSHPLDGAGLPKAAPSYTYDLYILVFRKGDSSHQFTGGIANTRGSGETYIPTVERATYNAGSFNANATPAITGAIPPIGGLGIGAQSGTVFRQGVNTIGGGAIARPLLKGQSTSSAPSEDIIYSPPADGTQGSPLIYIYQTTFSR